MNNNTNSLYKKDNYGFFSLFSFHSLLNGRIRRVHHNHFNIAKSEQSSHTPGGSHHRPYHFNLLERKKNWTNKGTDKQYVADSFIHIRTCHK